MYLWNTQDLANDLIKKTVPEFDKFIYLVVPIILASVSLGKGSSSNRSISFLISGLYAVVIAVLIFKCFSTYSKNKNSGFVETFTCLSFPSLIKSILMSIGLALIAMPFGFVSSFLATVMIYLGVIGPAIWMYIRLNHWMEYVSKAEDSHLENI